MERYANPAKVQSNQDMPVPVARSTMSGFKLQQQNGLIEPGFKPKSAKQFIPDNFEYQDLRKLVQLVIHIERQEGTGLGIRIAGGKGSSPFKEDDDVNIELYLKLSEIAKYRKRNCKF